MNKNIKFKPFKKAVVVGLGLIGGSLAIELKKNKLAKSVIGISRHERTLELAKNRNIIDDGSCSLGIAKGADIVILAAPVNTILKLGKELSKIVDKGCIVTDVGSTKQLICRKLGGIFCGFVGGHPLAGSEKRGIENARAGLFKGSLCLLTPTSRTDKNTLRIIEKLWRIAGADVSCIGPAAHDKALSFISHLPHIAAFSLIGCIPDKFLKLAPCSLRETTRIAASDSRLWSDIFLSNKENIVRSIRLLRANLHDFETAIKNNREKRLMDILKKAKIKRDRI